MHHFPYCSFFAFLSTIGLILSEVVKCPETSATSALSVLVLGIWIRPALATKQMSPKNFHSNVLAYQSLRNDWVLGLFTATFQAISQYKTDES